MPGCAGSRPTPSPGADARSAGTDATPPAAALPGRADAAVPGRADAAVPSRADAAVPSRADAAEQAGTPAETRQTVATATPVN